MRTWVVGFCRTGASAVWPGKCTLKTPPCEKRKKKRDAHRMACSGWFEPNGDNCCRKVRFQDYHVPINSCPYHSLKALTMIWSQVGTSASRLAQDAAWRLLNVFVTTSIVAELVLTKMLTQQDFRTKLLVLLDSDYLIVRHLLSQIETRMNDVSGIVASFAPQNSTGARCVLYLSRIHQTWLRILQKYRGL